MQQKVLNGFWGCKCIFEQSCLFEIVWIEVACALVSPACAKNPRNINKKVLLRERKRRTACHVASPWPGGPTLGYPSPRPDLGVGNLGYPSPRPDMSGEAGTLGYPLPPSGPGQGRYPPPPCVNWQTKWNYYLPHPSDAGGNDVIFIQSSSVDWMILSVLVEVIRHPPPPKKSN